MRNLQVELTISASFIRASCVATSSSEGSSARKISPEPSQVLEIHPVRERKVHKGRVGWLKMAGSALGTHPLQPHGLLDYVVLRLDRPLPAINLLDLIEGTV